MMRNWINLFESAMPFVLNDQFVEDVQKYLEEHLSDWADDFPDLKNEIAAMWERMSSESIHGDRIAVYREELRPLEQIEHRNYGSLGACWSWDPNGAQTCNHDNAYDEYGRDNVTEVMFSATVAMRDVDWVQSMAKNLVLKNEREITIRDGAQVHVEDQYAPKHNVADHEEFDIEITNTSEF